MATEDTESLRELAVSLKDETATLLNYIGRLESVDFKEIANVHTKQYYSTVLDSDDIIAAPHGILAEYDHNETFKIAYCTGLIPYLESTRQHEDYRRMLLKFEADVETGK